MSTIQPLPNDVVALIAAGEVIDSLAAVVRELVENALDANATRLTLALWPEQWQVRVVDNGSGMDLANLRQAALPHSTSKIRDRTDLWQITSLGFRGEALHSLAQLAELEICSRSADQAGWSVGYDHQGQPVQIERVAIAPGTVVTVSDLFAPLPSRRQGLPSVNQQVKAVQQLIQQMALCHPNVTWTTELRDRPWFSLWPSHSSLQIFPQLLRDVQPSDLREISLNLPSPTLDQAERFASNPDNQADNLAPNCLEDSSQFSKQDSNDLPSDPPNNEITEPSNISNPNSSALHKPSYVDQNLERHITLSNLEAEVENREFENAFKNALNSPEVPKQVTENRQESQIYSNQNLEPSDTNNQLYLAIGLPDRCHRRRPDWIRIGLNGRPVNAPDLEQAIFRAFRRTLPRDRYPVCFLHLRIPPNLIDWNRHPAKTDIYLHHMQFWQDQVMRGIEQIFRLNANSLAETYGSQRVNQLLKSAESDGVYDTSRTVQPANQSEDPSSLKSDTLTAIAQVHNMYILAEHPSGVWLIEQHIAHERVLYEQLCDRWQLVPLEPPIVLQQITPAQVEQLQRIGLEVDFFGEQLWAVRTAPASLAQRDDCTEALIELSLGGDLETALVATACRTAIRNGTSLSTADMQNLLDQWRQTRQPRTCPHGRPICLQLEESSLSRFFRRHWVIGKSHGI